MPTEPTHSDIAARIVREYLDSVGVFGLMRPWETALVRAIGDGLDAAYQRGLATGQAVAKVTGNRTAKRPGKASR